MNSPDADAILEPPFAERVSGQRHRTWQIALVLGLALFLPALTYYTSGVSVSLGTAAAASALLVVTGVAIKADWLVICAVVAVLIIAHLVVAALSGTVETSRALFSLVILEVMILAAFALSDAMARWSDVGIRRATDGLRVLFLIIAAFGLAGIQPQLGGGIIARIISPLLDLVGIQSEVADMDISQYAKPMYPFTEPSYFALAFAPLLVHASVTSKGWRRYAWLALGAALTYFVQNLTLLVAVMVAASVSLPASRLAALAVIAVLGIGAIDITYFTDRLTFTYDTTNLSALAFMQGWELMGDALTRTWGWGVGFQQLGFAPFDSPIADVVTRLRGTDANVKEGAFNAAKVICEFGLFGLAIVIAFAIAAVKSGLRLRAVASDLRAPSQATVLAASILCAYTVETFVRGVGYFSGTTLLMIAAWLYLRREKRAPAPPNS